MEKKKRARRKKPAAAVQTETVQPSAPDKPGPGVARAAEREQLRQLLAELLEDVPRTLFDRPVEFQTFEHSIEWLAERIAKHELVALTPALVKRISDALL